MPVRITVLRIWGNYRSEKNPLHRFVAYHLLNRQMATNDMVFRYAGSID